MTGSVAYFIGSAEVSSGNTCTITVGTPTGTGTSAGDAIVVGTSNSANGVTITGVTDSRSNTYTTQTNLFSSAENPTGAYIAAGATTPLSIGDTITVTWTGTGEKIAGAVGVPGAASSPVDQNPAPTSNAGSTSPSITSGTLAQAVEVCVAVECNGNAGGTTMVWSGGFTALLAPTFAGAGGQSMSIAAKTTSSTGAVTASGTITSAKWCMLLVTLKTSIPVITTTSLPGGTVGVTYTQPVMATAGYGGYTWSLASGSLPGGLSLSAGGVISGSPLVGGTSSFSVLVTDGNGNTATQALSITIAGPAPFPTGPLGEKTELLLGGTWTDITGRAKQSGTPLAMATITGGRQNQTTGATPTQTTPRWNNRDGALDPDNPVGPYYGQLEQNTPCRISIPRPDGQSYLRIEDTSTGSWAKTTAVANTTTLDIRIDADWSSYLPGVLASQGDTADPFWWITRLGDGTIELFWIDNSIVLHGARSTVPVPVTGRMMLRVLLTLSTGTVQFYTAPTMSGTQTLLSTVTGGGATTVLLSGGNHLYCGGSPVFTEVPTTGTVYEMKVLDGATVLADPQFFAQTPGTTSFTDSQSNAWSLAGTATISNRSYRGHFECASLPGEWDPAGRDVWVPVTLSGVLRRLQAGNAQIQSVMRRTIVANAAALGLLAYWTFEDAQGSTQVASGLPGGQPMTFSGAVPGFQATAGSLSADSDFPSSAQLPAMNNALFTASIPAPASAPSADTLTFLMKIPSGGDNPGDVLRMSTTGTVALYRVTYTTASNGTLTLLGYDANGNNTFTDAIATNVNGQAIFWTCSLLQNGGNINTYLQGTAIATNTGFGGFGTVAGTVGTMTRVSLGNGLTQTKFGHLAAMTASYLQALNVFIPPSNIYTNVFYSNPNIFLGLNPLNGWAGEPAGARFARLCAENSIAFRVYGPPDLTQLMGPQQIDTLGNVLQSCEDAERGFIYEPRETLGLGLRTLRTLTNQAPRLTLDYSLGQVSPPMKPARDDLSLRNDAVVTRNGGAAVQVQKTTGPLAVATAGDYQQALTVYVNTDSQPGPIAGWMVNVGATPGKRYPSIVADMATTAAAMVALQQTVADLRQGDYLQIISAPQPLLPPGSIKQLMWGWAETLGDKAWSFAWNAVPELPYEVALGGTGASDSAHGDTAGSQLHTGVNATATSLSVDTLSGPLWTTNAADFPFDVLMAGEQMTVTNITGSSSPQTFTVTRSVNGVSKAQTATTPLALFRTPIAALA